jgi:hypothetical protein
VAFRPLDKSGQEITEGATVCHCELSRRITWVVTALTEHEGVPCLLLDQGSRYFGPFAELELIDQPKGER